MNDAFAVAGWGPETELSGFVFLQMAVLIDNILPHDREKGVLQRLWVESAFLRLSAFLGLPPVMEGKYAADSVLMVLEEHLVGLSQELTGGWDLLFKSSFSQLDELFGHYLQLSEHQIII